MIYKATDSKKKKFSKCTLQHIVRRKIYSNDNEGSKKKIIVNKSQQPLLVQDSKEIYASTFCNYSNSFCLSEHLTNLRHTSLSFQLFWTRSKQLTNHTVFLWLFNIFVPILMGKWEINQQLTPQSDIANNISSKDATEINHRERRIILQLPNHGLCQPASLCRS